MSDPLSTQHIHVTTQSTGEPVPRLPAAPVVIGHGNRRRNFRARYELAERSVDNNEHFARANGGSALLNQSGTDRATMRDRIRHEMHEADPWLKGSQRATVVSTIGRGPWLEVKIPGNASASAQIADKFNAWFRNKAKGPRKMRTMCWAQGSDGTGLAMIVDNPRLSGPITLDFVPFEDEQIRRDISDRNATDRRHYLLDGVDEDEFGNPKTYHVTKRHPSEYPEDTPEPYDAKYVIDVFEKQRPSQGRGVSDYATAVRNGPLRRIYRRSTLDAAATAAKHSFVIETTVDRFDDGEVNFEDIDALESVPLYYGEGLALPKGWRANQMKSENPTTSHNEFIRGNVAEMGRAAGQPSLVATGDATGHNFAGGQLARGDWADDVDVRRQDWETECLDKLLEHWLVEAALAGEIPIEFADIDKVPHSYRWSRKRHQDTAKEYRGRAEAIKSGLTSRAFWQTDDGVNPDREDERAAEQFGMTLKQYRQMVAVSLFGNAAQIVLGLGKSADTPENPPPNDPDDPENDDEDPDDEDENNPESFEAAVQRINRLNGIPVGRGGGQYNR